MCWYCGCHTIITRKDEPITDYLAALRREIVAVSGIIATPPEVHHIHFGGGTPTIISPEAFHDLVRLLRAYFCVVDGAEIAVEIDPRTLTPAMAAALGGAGVTRVSFGVQTFDPVVQKAINRVQSFEQTATAITALRAGGVSGVNFDLIYGLPQQTMRSCIETVEKCLELRPDRLSVFGYAHVPAFKKHQRKIIESDLPDGEQRLGQAEAIAAALVSAGYVRIGFDHYALPDDSLQHAQASGALRRNFQGYTADRCATLIGFGASAIGRLPQGYVQNETVIRRYAEQTSREGLAAVKGYGLTDDDRLRAHIIERLMCDLEVDLGAAGAHGASSCVLSEAMPRLRALADEGLIRLEGTRIRVPEKFRMLVRTVASVFDAYLVTSSRTYSRAV
jgi:oxygen-independent coproporphyrinogen-3 oxidase